MLSAGALGISLAAVLVFSAAAPARTSEMPTPREGPTITGTPREGQTLTANNGQWLYSDGLGCGSECVYSYQWQRCDAGGGNCANIDKATNRTYLLTSNDVGNRVLVVNTLTKYDCNALNQDCRYVSSSQNSALTEIISAIPVAAPTVAAIPVLSGLALQGQALTASAPAFNGPQPITITYQWVRCDANGANCVAIAGATGQSYTLTSADVGSTIRVVATGSNAGGSAAATSGPSAVVQLGKPAVATAPVVSGLAMEDETLTASAATFTGPPPITIAYQWQRCDATGANCAAIAGAAQLSYRLTTADVGSTIRVVATGSNVGGSTPATSAQTSVVRPLAPRPGKTTLSIDRVSLPHQLIIDRIQFTPNPLRSLAPFQARFRVSDDRRFHITGALVQVVSVPFNQIKPVAEVKTDNTGWATLTLQPTARVTLKPGGSIVLFVRARKSGDNPLAGVSTRRLVQVKLG